MKFNTVYSELYSQEEGVLQGGVLSVLLFAIKINDIYKQIPQEPRFHTSLYVDDLQLSYRHSDLLIAKEKLQECLNRITEWTNRNGFHFSSEKTKAMHFTQLPELHPSPELYMYKKEIKYEKAFKFLGMIFDTKLTFKQHINYVKTECNKMIGVLRSICSQEWGSD